MYALTPTGVELTFTGDRLIAEIRDHGVTVTYDGLTGASVVAPDDMPTLGLCGNNNGKLFGGK